MKKRLYKGLTVIFLSMIGFIGCKKDHQTDPNSGGLNKNQAVAAIKDKIKGLSQTSTYQLNIPGKGFYSDINGNIIDLNSLKNFRTDYNCPDPADDYFSDELISMSTAYTCGQGFQVTVKYYVSVQYNLVAVNPLNSSQLSKGKLRLKNGSGVVVYSNTNIPIAASNIENLGADPSDGTLTRFRITFTTPYIADATYNGSTTAEPAAFIYTDCSTVASVSLPYTSSQSIATTANYTTPCTRYDKVYFNPANGGTHASVAGVDASGGCSIYGYVYPDQQFIQYYNTSTSSWVPMPFVFYGSTALGKIGNTDVWFVDRSTGPLSTPGTFQVRYANVETNTTYGGLCQSPDWVYESWYIN